MSMTAEGQGELRSAVARPSRWRWFPLVWVTTLVGICGGLWLTDSDPGLKHSAIHIAIVLAVMGLASWILLASRQRRFMRWALALIPLGLIASYYLQLLPIEVINNGDVGIVGWRWRWSEPDRLLAVPKTATAAKLAWRETSHDYPAFLNGKPWAEVEGVALETDWKACPPRLLWKQPIGAGWSGFAVVGDYAVTQEQRGDQELVVCYEVRTGNVAWQHADNVRWDPRGNGALGFEGPRATPTIHDGRVYSHGATGILNCIDASTGDLLWSHDTLAENAAANIMWGKSGSPLIVDDRVVVSVGGTDNASLVAYDCKNGKQAWAAGTHRSSYATPIVTELGGVRQILTVNEDYLTAHRIDDGAVLWEHEWPSGSDAAAAASQAVPIGNDRVLLTKGYGQGAQVIAVVRQSDAFTAQTLWESSAVLKTKFGNVLVRDGLGYGLDDVLLQCVDLTNGRQKWKKRRSPSFGHGQALLVGDVIVMLSEQGELVLVEVSPKNYRELAHMQAIDGLTWNNPALSGSLLLIRNAEEAACYELPLRSPPEAAGE
jgi:outer membrane protein assembly factor BamB